MGEKNNKVQPKQSFLKLVETYDQEHGLNSPDPGLPSISILASVENIFRISTTIHGHTSISISVRSKADPLQQHHICSALHSVQGSLQRDSHTNTHLKNCCDNASQSRIFILVQPNKAMGVPVNWMSWYKFVNNGAKIIGDYFFVLLHLCGMA